jgi:site-specific recombinase XerD
VIQRAVKEAVQRAGTVKHAKPHTFRHSFATRLPEDDYDTVPSRTCWVTATSPRP